MAIVYAPGELVEEVLPEDRDKPPEEQTTVVLKVPDEAAQRQILRVHTRAGLDPLEKLRTIFGLQIEEIRKLKVLRGGKIEEFVLEKDADGRISTASMAILAWKSDQIQSLIDKLGRVTRDDVKNF